MAGLPRPLAEEEGGKRANPSLFSYLMSSLGEEVQSITCAKVTVLHILYTIEELAHLNGKPGVFFICYGGYATWCNELRHYWALQSTTQRSYVLAGEPPPSYLRVQQLSSPGIYEAPMLDECFVGFLSSKMGFVLCARRASERVEHDVSLPFELFWSFAPDVITKTYALIHGADELFDQHQRAELLRESQLVAPPIPDAVIVTRFIQELLRFEEGMHMTIASARKVLEEQLRWHDDLTAMLVHDLRTPLQSITLMLEMLSGDPALDEASFKPMLDMAIQSAAGMDALIQTLLDMNLLETGSFAVQWLPINLRVLIRETTDPWMTLFERARLMLVVEFADPPTPPWGDPVLLARVLRNLLDNAVRFTPTGGTILIKMMLGPAGDHVAMQVKDTGRGIAPDVLPHIFERHYQSQRKDRRGGGMGLYFCKLAMAAQRGTIRAESVVGQGTTVTLTLPTRSLDAFEA